ncbi:MAG TPA: mechanosensitive ion channel family protein [Candidatus Polarisedimenticolia bacterium]|nr:mechanosensitive ion channel family protein [Candidatus Polarisedimenticolia bacterium]
MTSYLGKWLFDPTVGKLVGAAIGLLVIYVLVRFLGKSLSRYVADPQTRYRTRKFFGFLGYLAGFLLLASIFSDRLGQFTVAFGVAGAGIAFALQEVIASVAGWVAISFGNFYSPGDRVQLGGIKGDVIDIGILRTTLMEVGQWVNADLYNGRIVRVANSFIFKEPVFNYSADFPFLWDEITLPVRYGSDWEHTRTVLTGVVDEICGDYARASAESWRRARDKYRLEESHIEPMITLAATDNWIEFTVRYIVDYRRRRFVRDRLFTRVLEEVDKSGNRIRLASATFELTNIPHLDVQFSAGKGAVDPRYVP